MTEMTGIIRMQDARNTALSLLVVACMFLWCSKFLHLVLHVHHFWTVLYNYIAFLFRDMHFGKRTLKT